MLLLVLAVVLCLVSAAVEDSADLQLHHYDYKVEIVFSLLAKECPEYLQQKRGLTDFQKLRLDIKVSYVHHLEQLLLKCRRDKLVPTTSRTTASVTDPAPLCPSYVGDSIFNMLFISYNNPTNSKAPGVLCRTDGSPCSISLEICVSAIKSTKCEFYHHVTDVVGEKPQIGISDNFGNLTNPVKINLGSRKWQGAHAHITVLRRNSANNLRVYREVEEFSYDLTDVQGSSPRLVTLHGEHVTDKTELVVMFTVPCPSPSTTLPTTPSTTLPSTPSTTLPTTLSTTPPTTTTPPPAPAECLTATNLTQSWRLDHSGSDIRGGGPHALNGYACDWWDMGWFRFTGAAGTHMLDTCPKYRSCGTNAPYWTDGTPPQAVGVTANIIAYGMVDGRCKWYTLPMQVMRCSLSTDHDLIYKHPGSSVTGTCLNAFCGMN